jgi:uncharacterized protein YgiM (DUF1202 family)
LSRALITARVALAWVAITASLVASSVLAPTSATAAATTTWTANTSVNIRSGPSTSKTILGQLQEGHAVVAAGNVSGDWLPITWDNAKAYVWAEYLDQDKTAATLVTSGPAGRRTASVNVNVRATASLDAKITTILTKGTVVSVTGFSSGLFAQVTVDKATRWIHSGFLSTTTDTTPEVVASYTTTAKLALRTTASLAATNQKNIAIGSTVGSTGTHSGGYTQVVYKSLVGWVVTGYLKAVAGTPDSLVLPLRKATLYVVASGAVLRTSADAESAQVATLSQGDPLRTTGSTKNGYSEVIWNGATSWVATASLSATKPTTDLGSDSLNKLEPYGKAAVLEVRANFPEIKTIYGWRSSSAYSSDHPNGRAIDNMIPSYKTNKALGDRLAQYFIDNGKRLHVTYIIWRQRNYTISRGSWKAMEDRGSDTQNHMDHVHVSFEPS